MLVRNFILMSVPVTNSACRHCAVPSIGHQYGGASNNPGVTATSFQGGTCGIHFIDYQIPKAGEPYYYAARIVDNTKTMIAQVGNAESAGEDRAAVTGPMLLGGLLPLNFTYSRAMPGSLDNTPAKGDTDDAPITFNYNGQTWTSDDKNCKIGSFDNGARQGDCTFSC